MTGHLLVLSPPCCPVALQKEAIGDLSISKAQLRHSGRYTCTAQTVVDSASESATLTVRGNSLWERSLLLANPEQ